MGVIPTSLMSLAWYPCAIDWRERRRREANVILPRVPERKQDSPRPEIRRDRRGFPGAGAAAGADEQVERQHCDQGGVFRQKGFGEGAEDAESQGRLVLCCCVSLFHGQGADYVWARDRKFQ